MDLKKETLKLSIYDFDGTLYDGDSYVHFWLFLLKRNPRIYIFIPYQLLLFALWKFKIIRFQTFKDKFSIFMSVRSVHRYIKLFWEKNSHRIFPWVSDYVRDDLKKGLYPICISASLDILLSELTKDFGFKDLISTGTSGRFRVKLSTKNCRGREKVRRLKEWAKSKGVDFKVINMYSDSIADLPLYEISKNNYTVHRGHITSGIASKKDFF